ncbi:MAG TPA: hypothetical protein VG367_13130 [Mucilaginibacter sp.]|jgi:hypothetical protein|nr:hypothetical protein [Mucilaginibacter sp.]
MPTTKQSGNSTRENDQGRKMGSQQSSSSQSGRNKENRNMGSNSGRQSGNSSRTTHK